MPPVPPRSQRRSNTRRRPDLHIPPRFLSSSSLSSYPIPPEPEITESPGTPPPGYEATSTVSPPPSIHSPVVPPVGEIDRPTSLPTTSTPTVPQLPPPTQHPWVQHPLSFSVIDAISRLPPPSPPASPPPSPIPAPLPPGPRPWVQHPLPFPVLVALTPRRKMRTQASWPIFKQALGQLAYMIVPNPEPPSPSPSQATTVLPDTSNAQFEETPPLTQEELWDAWPFVTSDEVESIWGGQAAVYVVQR
jgi:hypothetical protein